MKKYLFFAIIPMLAACAFPQTPEDGDLVRATRRFQPELFATGSRGEVIVRMRDDRTDGAGWFGKKYQNILHYRNVSSGEAGYLEMDSGGFATAMLPIGDYEITNLKLSYVWTETRRQGNATITTTHVEQHEGFQGNDRLSFNVRPGQVLYLGDIELHFGDNAVSKDDKSVNANSYRLADNFAGIPAATRDGWAAEFGRAPEVGMIQKGNKK